MLAVAVSRTPFELIAPEQQSALYIEAPPFPPDECYVLAARLVPANVRVSGARDTDAYRIRGALWFKFNATQLSCGRFKPTRGLVGYGEGGYLLVS